MNPSQTEIAPEILQKVEQLEFQISQAIIGQKQVIKEIIIALLAGGHVLVEGVPGLGKTLLIKSLAAAIGGDFSRVQFTPDLMPSDISGHMLFDMQEQKFKVRKGPIFCHFLLADEINRAPAKTQAALLEVMQEQQVTIEGKCFKLAEPFLVLATQNPIEQEGTYPLPQAQLDRFLMKIYIDYPTEAEERALTKQITSGLIGDKLNTEAIQQVLSPTEIVVLQKSCANLEMDEQIIHYAVDIVRNVRQWNGVESGAGPRGSIALIRAGRANALLAGRNYVIPDDIKSVTPAVMRHRIKLSADLEIEGIQVDTVLKDILEHVDAPRI